MPHICCNNKIHRFFYQKFNWNFTENSLTSHDLSKRLYTANTIHVHIFDSSCDYSHRFYQLLFHIWDMAVKFVNLAIFANKGLTLAIAVISFSDALSLSSSFLLCHFLNWSEISVNIRYCLQTWSQVTGLWYSHPQEKLNHSCQSLSSPIQLMQCNAHTIFNSNHSTHAIHLNLHNLV